MSFTGLFARDPRLRAAGAGGDRPPDAPAAPPDGRPLRRARADGGRRRGRRALAHGGGDRRPGHRGVGDRGRRGDDRQLPADGGALAGERRSATTSTSRCRAGAAVSPACDLDPEVARAGRRAAGRGAGRARSAAVEIPAARGAGPADRPRRPTAQGLARAYELQQGDPDDGLARLPRRRTRSSSPSRSPAARRRRGRHLRLPTERGDRGPSGWPGSTTTTPRTRGW